MEVIFKKGKIFKKLIENCNNLISIGCLKFNENGIYLNTIDNNQTAVIYFHIPSSNCTTYKIDEEINLTIDFNRLSKIVFKTYKDTDEMKIKYVKSSDKIKFIFKNTTTKKTATHTVPLLNNEMDEIELPDIDYDSEILIRPMVINTITKDFEKIGTNLRIRTLEKSPNNEIIFSISDLQGDAEYKYEENDEDIEEINIKKEIDLTFLVSYLSKFASFSSISDELRIYLTNDAPLLYNYKTKMGDIKLYLSPTITE